MDPDEARLAIVHAGGKAAGGDASGPRAKFEVYGEEMIEKEVKLSGNSGRVYLPQEWVGKSVKIIRVQ